MLIHSMVVSKKGAMPKSMRRASSLEKRRTDLDEQRKSQRQKAYELVRNEKTVAVVMRATGITRVTTTV